MKCRRLQLINFCQHHNSIFEFGDGLNCIVGPNGSGKSNVLNGIRFAFTGATVNHGTKADDINVMAGRRDSSKVLLDFHHDGHEYKITRSLKNSKPDALLERDGVEIATGQANVTTLLFEILQIDPALFGDVVIVAQEELFGFIAKKPAARAEQFQSLFQTKVAEKVYDAAHKELSVSPTQDSREEHQRWLDHAATAQSEIIRVTQQIQAMRPKLDLMLIIQNAKSASEYTGRLAAAREHLAACQSKWTPTEEQTLEFARQEAQAALLKWQTLGNQREELSQKVIAARATMESVSSNKAARARRSQLQSDIAGLRAQLENLQRFTANYDVQQREKEILEAREKSTQLDVLIRQLHLRLSETTAGGTCPTCKQAMPDMSEQRAQWQAEIQNLNQQKMDAFPSTWTVQHTEMVQRLQQQQNLSLRIESETQSLQAIVVPDADPDDTQERNLVVAWNDLGLLLKEAETARLLQEQRVMSLEATKRTAALMMQQAEHTLQTLLQNPVAAVHDPAKVTEAENEYRTLLQAETYLDSLQTQVKQASSSIQILDAKVKAEQVERNWRTVLEGVKQFMHRDNLPRLVASNNMRTIQTELNKFLSVFSTDFTIFSDDGISFIARFRNGKLQPVERLSGAQKAITALSFRLAVNRLLAGHVGMLILDEPTVYQDEQNIAAFQLTLDRLKQLSASRGLQCVIVTHEKELAARCQHVITIR